MNSMENVVVFITVSSKKEAEKIAASLVKKGLAACVNIIGGVESIFKWKGKIEKADELLLLAKTKKSLFKELRDEVKSLHSYETPEIIALPIVMGDKDYLKWVKDVTKKGVV